MLVDQDKKDKVYYILPNGKCPFCKEKVGFSEKGQKIYRNRLLKIKNNNELRIKCPGCGHFINIV